MNITIVCEDCGRKMSTQVVKGKDVTITVHGCRCKAARFRERYEARRRRASEAFQTAEAK